MGESPFPYGFSPGETDLPRRWLHRRHQPLLGQHLPRERVPQWPSVHVEPGYALDRAVPTHFKAYTATEDGTLWADTASTWDEARWVLENRVRDAGF
jgi:hypothetical protein